MSSYQVRARSGTPIADDFDSDIPPLVEDFDTGRTFSVTEAGVITLIGPMNQAEIGFILYPRTAAEIAAGVTPTSYAYPTGHILRYGTNTVPGTTDMTTALASAAVLEIPAYAPRGTYLISSPVTFRASLYGDGDRDGMTVFTFTSTGQFVIGDWHVEFAGFMMQSAVNNLVFIKNAGQSFFLCRRWRANPLSGATGQEAIRFDTTTASIYLNDIRNFKTTVDHPFHITGNSTQVFNANRIGCGLSDQCQSFATAISIDGVLTTDANNFEGYFETGTQIVNIDAGNMRQNRFRIVQDGVTFTFKASTAVVDPNIWEILDPTGFVTSGTVPTDQIFIGPYAVGPTYTKVRGTDTSAQVIGTAAATTITFNAETFDNLSEFVNGTGIFTAKHAGYYQVSAAALSASVAWTAGQRWEARIYKNAALYASGDFSIADANTTRQRMARVTALISCAVNDTIDFRIIHNQGGNVALDATATNNYIEIERIA